MSTESVVDVAVAGGTYRERCLRPHWAEIYGSGGRAASALASIGVRVTFHSYLDPIATDVLTARSALEGFTVVPTATPATVCFDYDHGLATPRITGVPVARPAPLSVTAERVLRFGMLDGDAVVHAREAVYDPQDALAPVSFHANGSTAERLAIVLNGHEARLLLGSSETRAETLAIGVAAASGADVVVIKQGAQGACVVERGRVTQIPAYASQRVWKIGSGDAFAAYFAYGWMVRRLDAAASADLASRATAYYCETRGFATEDSLQRFAPPAVAPSHRFIEGRQPMVYLAGPFFTLAQLWLVEQARHDLRAAGMTVFSPYHDVGHGSADDVAPKDFAALRQADLVYAIGDGIDAGTIFEVGYARALDKPVVIYVEHEMAEDLKMMEGSACVIENDYVTSIYRALWCACQL